ncbi:hypothetical protein RHGRI_005737 [Rhododendron griersonianum]|uniref:Uncharacterized protein n=1 Tax=Rhododendron griersonianum TaxID=479676 RepID=A0AAV6LEI1_9ERIC|nr:hypothetical protein RHGRI_005737 [Rhododendron griersonianum]
MMPWRNDLGHYDLGRSKLSTSLDKAGYAGMSWFVENRLIPTVRSVYGYNDTITIFAPEDTAFFYYKGALFRSQGDSNVLQQVVPLRLDRHTFRSNFSKDSTFPTFSQDFANPSFQLSDHIRVTRPLVDDATGEDAGQKATASINDIELKTAPADFRFPTTNQSRHCFTRYIEFHRCVAAKGDESGECGKFAKYYRSLCPGEWVERWNEQRENGTFPGPL